MQIYTSNKKRYFSLQMKTRLTSDQYPFLTNATDILKQRHDRSSCISHQIFANTWDTTSLSQHQFMAVFLLTRGIRQDLRIVF